VGASRRVHRGRERTQERAAGVRLGVHGAETLAPKYRGEAKVRAEQLAPVIRELQRDGYSMRGIAVELDKRKVPTPRGGAWHPQLVKRIVRRLEQQVLMSRSLTHVQ
jgi:hypothetical protein